MAFIKQRNKTEAYMFGDIGKPEQILITVTPKKQGKPRVKGQINLIKGL
jgi:hypothetical protein